MGTVFTDTQIICATNTDLKRAVNEDRFSSDLYNKLKNVSVYIPPLRERKEEIILLAEHFLQKSNAQLEKNMDKISEEAKELMLDYSWPGNVRELRNVIGRVVFMEEGTALKPEHLSSEFHRK